MALTYRFRCLVCYRHGGTQGDTQVDMVLEKELRGLHLNLPAVGRDNAIPGLTGASETSKVTPKDTLPPTTPHLLQQGHTSQWHHSLSLWGHFSFKLPQCVFLSRREICTKKTYLCIYDIQHTVDVFITYLTHCLKSLN